MWRQGQQARPQALRRPHGQAAAVSLQNPATQQTGDGNLLGVAGNSAGGGKPQAPEAAKEGKNGAGCTYCFFQRQTANIELEKFSCTLGAICVLFVKSPFLS